MMHRLLNVCLSCPPSATDNFVNTSSDSRLPFSPFQWKFSLYHPSPVILSGEELEDLVQTDRGRKRGKVGGGKMELRDGSPTTLLTSGVTRPPAECLALSRHGTNVFQMTGLFKVTG